MINLVVLDIDGVLNRQHFGKDDNERFGFADDCVQNLKFILDSVPYCKILVSSAWRKFIYEDIHLDPKIPWREVLANKLGVDMSIFIGDTPELFGNGETRADEIAKWLADNKEVGVGAFVILDDEVSCYKSSFPNNIVDCDILNGTGLSKAKAKEAVWILTKSGRDKPMDERTFFISDTHFFHANIIKYCNRPFASVEEMNEKLIENWNSVVGKDDLVWHLGDFVFGKDKIGRSKEILSRLNGKVNLVLGNHDLQGHDSIKQYYDAGFNRVYDKPVLINNFFILSHEPIQWVKDGDPYANIYGHVHDMEVYKTFTKNTCCVCVERWDYKPIPWKEIEKHFIKGHDE